MKQMNNRNQISLEWVTFFFVTKTIKNTVVTVSPTCCRLIKEGQLKHSFNSSLTTLGCKNNKFYIQQLKAMQSMRLKQPRSQTDKCLLKRYLKYPNSSIFVLCISITVNNSMSLSSLLPKMVLFRLHNRYQRNYGYKIFSSIHQLFL